MYTKLLFSKPIARVICALTFLGLLLSGSLAARAEPGQAEPPAPVAAQHTTYLPLITRPGTAPGGASSDELIDTALKRGEIDAETALIYRVFVAFVDPRLPARFRGDDSQPSDREIAGELAARFKQLSPQAKAILEPFTIPPYHTGSWWDLRQNRALAATSAIGPAELRCGQVGNHFPLLLEQWRFVDSANGMARVWWQARYPVDEQKARDYAGAIDTIWLKLHTLMGRQPPSDEGATESCGGGGDQLDISLVDIGNNGEAYRDSFAPLSTDATPSYILLNRTSQIGTLIHELMHSFQFAFDRAGSYDEYRWWGEATATWAINYVDPKLDHEHGYAPAFLDAPDLPLETYVSSEGAYGQAHQYGAYLFPFFIQLRSGGKGDFVRQSYERAERIADSLENLNGLLSGGFREQWPEFTLRNVNQPPVDDYWKADTLPNQAKLTLNQKVELHGAPSVAYALDGKVEHLAAHHYRFEFTDAAVRSVIFENPFAGGMIPTAHVHALYRIEPNQWATEDWTDKLYVTFCRDMRADRVKELYIVISNSEWSSRSHKLEPATAPRLQATNVGCRGWKVDAEFTNILEGSTWKQTNTIVTTAIMERYVEPGVRGPTEHYRVASGTANWTSEGNIGPCAGSMSGTYDVRNVVGGYNMIVETYGLSNSVPVVSGSRKYHAVGVGPPDQPAPLVPYVCPNGPVLEASANIGMWLQTDLQGPFMQHSISADGKRLVGSSTSTTEAQGATITRTSKWTMTALPPE